MKENGVIKSFSNALRGIRVAFGERSFRLQILAAIAVLAMMLLFNISLVEKSILILLIIIVLILEILNSILERLVDVLKPRMHSYVKDVKDMAAGAVFVASIGAAAVGIIIFYPHIQNLLEQIFKF
jgi:diacylglycerol kinase